MTIPCCLTPAINVQIGAFHKKLLHDLCLAVQLGHCSPLTAAKCNTINEELGKEQDTYDTKILGWANHPALPYLLLTMGNRHFDK